jgi:hypothetical protein
MADRRMAKRPMPKKAGAPTLAAAPQRARQNIRLAVGLVLVAAGFCASVFVWRFMHHQPPMPEGSGYGAAYVTHKDAENGAGMTDEQQPVGESVTNGR